MQRPMAASSQGAGPGREAQPPSTCTCASSPPKGLSGSPTSGSVSLITTLLILAALGVLCMLLGEPGGLPGEELLGASCSADCLAPAQAGRSGRALHCMAGFAAAEAVMQQAGCMAGVARRGNDRCYIHKQQQQHRLCAGHMLHLCQRCEQVQG